MFPMDVKVKGIGKKNIYANMSITGCLYITRVFKQSTAGSAPSKVAGQVLSIIDAYPRVHQINLDFSECTGITENQFKMIYRHMLMIRQKWGIHYLIKEPNGRFVTAGSDYDVDIS